MLNPNAQLWVDALRSGYFAQTTNTLSRGGNEHCCLGVACQVYIQNGGDLKVEKDASHSRTALVYVTPGGARYSAELPNPVREWLGLSTNLGDYEDGTGKGIALTDLNDDKRLPFDQIADVIESEPEGLFRS